MLERLNAIADLVPPAMTVADIGCDHGLLSKILLERGTAKKVIACDISAPSLLKIRELKERFSLCVDIRCGDGLEPIAPGEVQSAVIAGMGGREILHILSNPGRRDGIGNFIVSPQSDLPLFRRELAGIGLEIDKEQMVKERGHFYTVMRLKPGGRRLLPAEEEFGLLVGGKDAVFLDYLESQRRMYLKKLARFGRIPELVDGLERVVVLLERTENREQRRENREQRADNR